MTPVNTPPPRLPVRDPSTARQRPWGSVSPMLNRLAAEHATGVLVRERGTLYLSEGRVVHAESPATPGIDVLLTAAGAVDPEGWQRAVEGAEADPERPVSRTLISQGVLSQGQLELCHLGSLFDAAYFALAPSSAPGHFRYGAWHWMGAVRPVPVSALERETMRRRSLLNRIWPDPSTDTAPLTLIRPARAAQACVRRQAILDLVDGRRTATDIARELGRPAFHTLVDLRRLAAAGLVAATHRPAPPAHPAPPVPPATATTTETTAASLPVPPPPAPPASPPAAPSSPYGDLPGNPGDLPGDLPGDRPGNGSGNEFGTTRETAAGAVAERRYGSLPVQPSAEQLHGDRSYPEQPYGEQPYAPPPPPPSPGVTYPEQPQYAQQGLVGQLLPLPAPFLEQPSARTRPADGPPVRPVPLVPLVQPLPPPAPQPPHPVRPPDDRVEQPARNHPDVDTPLPRRPSGGRHRAGRAAAAPAAPAPHAAPTVPAAPTAHAVPAAPAVPPPRTPAAAPSSMPPTHFADPDVTLLQRLRAALEAL